MRSQREAPGSRWSLAHLCPFPWSLLVRARLSCVLKGSDSGVDWYPGVRRCGIKNAPLDSWEWYMRFLDPAWNTVKQGPEATHREDGSLVLLS